MKTDEKSFGEKSQLCYFLLFLCESQHKVQLLQMLCVMFCARMYYSIAEQYPKRDEFSTSQIQKKSNLNQKDHRNCFLMQLQRSDSFASDVESLVRFATPTQYLNMSHLFYLPVLRGRLKVTSVSVSYSSVTYVCRPVLLIWFVINQVLPIEDFWMLITGFCFRIDTRPVTVLRGEFLDGYLISPDGPFFFGKRSLKQWLSNIFTSKTPKLTQLRPWTSIW